MPVDPELRSLDIDVPARPDALVRLSLLLADEAVNLSAVADLVEGEMALASAVLKAVNSSLYGLKGRVQNVHQAAAYLGTQEIAGVAFEMGLRAAFPASPQLDAIWARAAQRGLWMGRMAQALGVDAWVAHSAGLFEECGKAVLFRHAPEHYPALLRAAGNDVELCQLEAAAFGVSHDALGAALCESWGLAGAAVACVRQHVTTLATLRLDGPLPRRQVLALALCANGLLVATAGPDAPPPEGLAARLDTLAPQAGLDAAAWLQVALKLLAQHATA